MPPHCDSKDGPVVTAAMAALEAGRIELVLPYVPSISEAETQDAYDKTMAARACSPAAKEVADEWFCETVVRLHRAGEGAAYTGLKPAGLGHGVVVPVAERAVQTGDASELVALLSTALREETLHKFETVMHLKSDDPRSVAEDREYVEAMLGFIVWSHKTHQCITSDPLHDHGSMHE
jgi:hypothetical protein